jgi:hypothetical protein
MALGCFLVAGMRRCMVVMLLRIYVCLAPDDDMTRFLNIPVSLFHLIDFSHAAFIRSKP